MQFINRTSICKDIENPAETIVSSSCFLRAVAENMNRETRKTVTCQQSYISSFDDYVEKRK